MLQSLRASRILQVSPHLPLSLALLWVLASPLVLEEARQVLAAYTYDCICMNVKTDFCHSLDIGFSFSSLPARFKGGG